MSEARRFADAFFFIALLNSRDAHHQAALAIAPQLRNPLLTTSLILVEVADALSDPKVRPLVHEFLMVVQRDVQVEVVSVDGELLQRGIALYGARPDKGWSLTDCVSFVVMKERAIAEALTGDHHFEQAGFAALMR